MKNRTDHKKNSRKNCLVQAVSLFLTGCIFVSGIPAAYGIPADTGEETEAQESRSQEEIHITTPEELRAFADQCTLDSWSRDKAVYLDADIQLGDDFSMIPSFGGSFYGQGHTISGLNIKSEGSYTGLFRYIQESGSVLDLKVNGQVKPEGSRSSVGGIAGSNAGRIENCAFQGSVYGKNYIGGIAGRNQGSGQIVQCTTAGVIYGNHGAGGIAGENRGVITRCRNENYVNAVIEEETIDLSSLTIEDITSNETVTDITDVGGIAGISSGVIQNCTNKGLIGYQHIGYNIGGIAGRQSGYIYACVNEGYIYGRKEVGGIVGQMEPNMVLEYSQTTLQKLQPQLQTLRSSIDKTLADMNGTTTALGKELENLSPYVTSASQSAEAMLNAYKAEQEDKDEAGNISSDRFQDEEGNIDPDKIQDELDQLKPSGENAQFQAARTDFSNSMKQIADVLARMGRLLAEDGTAVNQDIQNISDQIFGILDTLTYGTEQTDTDVIEDVSDEDDPDAIEGKVAGSSNQGMVEGDLNVGGIAGAMAIEHDLDPEDDIQIEGEASLNVQYRTRVVIRDCENAGEIQGRKDCTGGIVGNMAMGSVMESRNTGRAASDGGDYVGGIAGLSEGIIRNCSVKCWLSGRNHVGGIAGLGSEIYTSYTLVRIEDSVESAGAIAGELKENGIAEGNLFIGTDMAGIDGISYAGAAEPVTWQELTAQEDSPELFQTCTVRFIANEETVGSITVDYGSGIQPEEVPAVPEKEGCYGAWEEWNPEDICFDERIHAVYTSYVTALETSETRNDSMALALTDGTFKEEDVLTLEAWEGQTETAGGKNCIEAWTLTIPEDGSESHTVRYLPPEGEKGIEIYVLNGNNWNPVEWKEDGKYLVFEVQEQQVTFQVLARKKPFWYFWFHSKE